ncbi:MAG: cysteine desulfurase [Proteobacteria bacterium]|nr:MAG: cysteine desulfurase [Pseudomonadota bacterium]
MVKLNFMHVNMLKNHIFSNLSLDSLSENEEYEAIKKELLNKFDFKWLNTFSFCKYGFLGLFLELNQKGKIALCKGESEALIEAGKLFESLGFELLWVNLEKDGKINLNDIKNNEYDYLFLSSFIMDTFVRVDLKHIKTLTNASIISNASLDFSKNSDAVYFDTYKLSGFSSSSVLLFNGNMFEEKSIGFTDTIAVSLVLEGLKNQHFQNDVKGRFLQELKDVFGNDLFLFVDPNETFECSLHVGFKRIRARELIRSLAFEEIFITNGEGCALGLSKPSRIIKEMNCGLDNTNAIGFSFSNSLSDDEISQLVKIIHKKYRQIRALNG